MKYKGYIGHITYNSQTKQLHGEVIGLKDIVTFQGTNVEELEIEFKNSIDDYLELCKKRNEKPEKKFSGNLRIRIAPDLHAKLAHEAFLDKKSLNTLIIDKLKK